MDRALLLLFSDDLDGCVCDLSFDLLVEDLSLVDFLDVVEGRLDDSWDFAALSFSFECLVDGDASFSFECLVDGDVSFSFECLDDDDASLSFECLVDDDASFPFECFVDEDNDDGSFSFECFVDDDDDPSLVVQAFVVGDDDVERSLAELDSFSLLDFFTANVALLSSLPNLLSSLDIFGLLRVSSTLSSLDVFFLLLFDGLVLSTGGCCREPSDESVISVVCRLLSILGEGL